MKHLLLAVAVLAAPAAAQEVPFDWKLRPEVGSKWELRSFTRQKHSSVVPDGGNPTSKKQRREEFHMVEKKTLYWDVLSKDALGNLTIKATFGPTEISAKTFSDGKLLPRTDSDEQIAEDQLFAKVTNGHSYTMKVTPEGRVLNVLGLEPLRQRWKAATHQPVIGIDANDIRQKLEELNKEHIELSTRGGTLPTSPLAIGAGYSFVHKASPTDSDSPDMQITRTLTGRSNGVAQFNEIGSIVSSGKRPMRDVGPPSTRYEAEGTMSGTMEVNETTGLAVRNQESIRTKMQLEFELPNGQRLSLPIWSLVEGTSVIEPRN